MWKTRPIKACAFALCALTMLAPAWAHHAGAGFDMSKQYVFHGTIRKFLWANPHVWLYVIVVRSDGSQELWGFEGAGTNVLARSGWKAADLREGDKITVFASPAKDGVRNAAVQKVVLADGRTLQAIPALPPQGSGIQPPAPSTPIEYK